MSDTQPIVPTSSDSMKDKIIFWAGTTAITVTLGWCGIMSAAIHHKPDMAEVKDMLVNQSPYIADKGIIKMQLDRNAEIDQKILATLDRNTDAITALRIELAKIAAIREREAKYGSIEK